MTARIWVVAMSADADKEKRMNPFHVARDYLLERVPQAYDFIYVSGKVSRALFILLIVALVLAVRETWVRMWRRDISGDAFANNQAFAFAALTFALVPAYALIPEISWKLCLAVTTTILIFITGLSLIRLFAAGTHRKMIGGDMIAADRIKYYVAAVSGSAIAVVFAAFNT